MIDDATHYNQKRELTKLNETLKRRNLKINRMRKIIKSQEKQIDILNGCYGEASVSTLVLSVRLKKAGLDGEFHHANMFRDEREED